ncbi:hypothetical protein BFJ66_g1176 [Fusarium oxysporum f. sp. cepae]|uniref:Uncharacterized protein n=1 Tax=Fusarium oxysporum f. sp. cepae TaxID=396571 RepID=A0A3L6NJU1_FUSOX|nr:hypothetical protein BFJ65_g8060 [Fusarium oxysporum f. sp. cepae]RKK58556.1 hypothetical protein BFJ67_g2916 [Fusarium oxysporum f. sp. cepae]RKK61887.1 hypothetical protein BFJ66_g1176 [Fusarium oxysporum f. sp. cepae]
MSISDTVLPSIEDPDSLTTFPSPAPSPNDREMSYSPDMERLLDMFRDIDIEKVRDIQAKQIRESTQRISKRLAGRSGWFCQKQGPRNLFNDIRLSNTQEAINKDFRLYRNISQHHGAQHTLEWAEQRGSNIMIVSCLSRSMGKHRGQSRLKLWTRFHKHIRDVINQRIQEIEIGNGELTRVFYIIQVTNSPQEVVWHLIRKHPGTCT